MTTSLTPSALCKVVSFVHCNCPISQPNHEKLRDCSRKLVDVAEDATLLNCKLLPAAEYAARKEGDTEAARLFAATYEDCRDTLQAFREGRGR